MVDKQIASVERRLDKLEEFIEEMRKYMENWGPDVQKRRDERDAIWDEMVRVVTIQKKNNENK